MSRAIMESFVSGYTCLLRSVNAIAQGQDCARASGIGGDRRSRVSRQTNVDSLGPEYACLDRDEFGTLGSAIVAGDAIGLFEDHWRHPLAVLPDSRVGDAAGSGGAAGLCAPRGALCSAARQDRQPVARHARLPH